VKGLDALITGLDDALERALAEAAAAGVAVAKKAAGSGPVARSIRAVRRGPLAREIMADAEGAVFLEQGRGPAEAHGNAPLHFVVNGKDVFARRVGPAKPHPFLAPAAAELERVTGELVEGALEGIVT
jgi:hypothetical protein